MKTIAVLCRTAVIIEDKSKINMKIETRSLQNPNVHLEIVKICQFLAEQHSDW